MFARGKIKNCVSISEENIDKTPFAEENNCLAYTNEMTSKVSQKETRINSVSNFILT